MEFIQCLTDSYAKILQQMEKNERLLEKIHSTLEEFNKKTQNKFHNSIGIEYENDINLFKSSCNQHKKSQKHTESALSQKKTKKRAEKNLKNSQNNKTEFTKSEMFKICEQETVFEN
ncbi:hypothetical protein EHP00_323 [Ecytonucleospora hepatopenaei]|uniref:Uncharacterized protein n=1 Tax=Ecytonucleospora hepatopenaei TaxID=646526 RepID=A0A1W0E777_9MICR|nr:hypothetical protein EHP00_323 [Ecytonucleospora hepatopenaei]